MGEKRTKYQIIAAILTALAESAHSKTGLSYATALHYGVCTNYLDLLLQHNMVTALGTKPETYAMTDYGFSYQNNLRSVLTI